ncbi:unnamed protein product [Hapterophycus canaliculatus]
MLLVVQVHTCLLLYVLRGRGRIPAMYRGLVTELWCEPNSRHLVNIKRNGCWFVRLEVEIPRYRVDYFPNPNPPGEYCCHPQKSPTMKCYSFIGMAEDCQSCKKNCHRRCVKVYKSKLECRDALVRRGEANWEIKTEGCAEVHWITVGC